MPREHDTPPTSPGIRESQLTVDRGPIYEALARELATRLYAARLDDTRSAEERVACGHLARDCDTLALSFGPDFWSAWTDEGKRLLIRDWQDAKARARVLGFEIL